MKERIWNIFQYEKAQKFPIFFIEKYSNIWFPTRILSIGKMEARGSALRKLKGEHEALWPSTFKQGHTFSIFYSTFSPQAFSFMKIRKSPNTGLVLEPLNQKFKVQKEKVAIYILYVFKSNLSIRARMERGVNCIF